MLDELLGKAELKNKISELQEERDQLQNQLEAAQQRRKEATRAKQEAEETINRLEDRITELEDRVQRAESQETTLSFRDQYELRGDQLEKVLDRLTSYNATDEELITTMIIDDIPEIVRSRVGNRVELIRRATPCVVFLDNMSLIELTLTPARSPDTFVTQDNTFSFERSWFEPTGAYTFGLIRSDIFAVGRYEHGECKRIEGFNSNIDNKHSKGGFSQKRFERRREEQISDHLTEAKELLSSFKDDTVILVGHHQLLSNFDVDTTATVDVTGDPKEALREAHNEFWTIKLRVI